MGHKALRLGHTLLFTIILLLANLYFYFHPITALTPLFRLIIFSVLLMFFLAKSPLYQSNYLTPRKICLWLTFFLIIFVRLFVFSMDRIMGDSMYPTLHNGDIGIYLYGAHINRFDIVSVLAPDHQAYYTKRVIGLEGETIEIKEGHVYINHKKIHEDFLHIRYPITLGPYSIPEGHVFLIGDNRPISLDSTRLGAFDTDTIDSKLIFKFSPFPIKKPPK